VIRGHKIQPNTLPSPLQKILLYSAGNPARVAKLVDALVLGTSGAIHGGSSPLPRTKKTALVAVFVCSGSKVWETLREDLKRLPATL
jgi:hypothetical protein